MKLYRHLVVYGVSLVLPLIHFSINVQAQPTVPPNYQDLYNSLGTQIDNFAATIPPSNPYPVSFATELISANSNRGSLLLSTPYSAVLQEVDSLKALGLKAIKVGIHFPILYAPFYQQQSQYQQYVNFYTRLASDIHSRGLKMIVESGLVLNEPGISDTNCSNFYSSLSQQQYEQGRAQVAVTIAQQVKPDYLSVLNEPDTESSQSGFAALGTPSGSVEMLSTILTALQQAGITNIPIGAGVGSWLPTYQTFIQNYLTLPVQYIDIHIFPANENFLPNATDIAKTTITAGKQLAVSQVWLQKVRDSELATMAFPQLEARDPFSFWEPLDSNFLQTMVAFSNANQLLYLSPFFSALFHANTDYSQTSTLGIAQIMSTEYQLSSQAIANGQYTPTAQAYSAAILGAPDITPPSVPSGFSTSASTSAISLSWAASTDNVGVAGYQIYRNGALVATSMSPVYYDLSLPGSTTFTYQVAAYDVAGNVSVQSSPVSATTLTPQNNTPPTTPANLTVLSVTGVDVSLSWTASSDNIGVAGYQIYRGTSAASLALIAGASTPSYIDTKVSPSSTYYYAVRAYDSQGHLSALSAVIPASTTQENPPSVPTNLNGQAASFSQVNLSWGPSAGSEPLSGYLVYRGTSPTALSLLASTPATSYSDNTTPPSTNLYYAVLAYDIYGLQSAQSAPVSVVTPKEPPPSVPTGLSAQSISFSQVNLAWNSSTGSETVAGYLVYRGTSATSLSLIAGSKATSYSDTTVSPSATYYYAVAAYDIYGVISPQSAPVSATTPKEPPPSVPAGVTAVAASYAQINLSWNASTGSKPVSGYLIYRGVSPSSLKVIASNKTVTYSDNNVAPSTTFYYAVAAYDIYGVTSAQSAPVSATTPQEPPPTVPTGLSAQVVSSTSATLSWGASTSPEGIAGYLVYKGISPTSLNIAAGVSGSTTSYTDTTLVSTTTFYYAVVAYDKFNVRSAQSNIISVNTSHP